MAIEKERRFLVDPKKLPKELMLGKVLRAGYFTKDDIAIRVSISSTGARKICFKTCDGEVRQEFEYDIPLEDAEQLMLLAPTSLSKTRFEYQGWEIDCFHTIGGLWIAEYEEQEGKDPIPKELPEWIFSEITGDQDYGNASLAWRYGKKT